jgi:hypothetical protein
MTTPGGVQNWRLIDTKRFNRDYVKKSKDNILTQKPMHSIYATGLFLRQPEVLSVLW